MSCACDKYKPCNNKFRNKITIVDTCAIIQLIETILRIIGSSAIGQEKYSMFMDFLEDFLSTVTLCPQNEIFHTSEALFLSEMDPTNVNSRMRKILDDYDVIYDGDPSKYQKIKTIFTKNIKYIKIKSKEIRYIKNMIKKCTYVPISDIDASLIVQGLLDKTETDIVLITNDSLIHDTLACLEFMRLKIDGRDLNSSRILPQTMLTYCTEIYECCKFLDEQFYSMYDEVKSYVEDWDGPEDKKSSLHQSSLDYVIDFLYDYVKGWY